MKLSEAIDLGRTLVVLDASCYQRCLLGIGHTAIGKDPYKEYRADFPEYPWLNTWCENPPFGAVPGTYVWVIGQLARRIVWERNITMEQAIDWIRSVEPAEETSEDIIHEQVLVESKR